MSAPEESGARYDIRTDVKYGPLELIDIPAEIAGHEPWFNQTLAAVNDSVARLGILVHRTRAPVRTAVLMVEPAGVVPTGDD